MAWSGRSVCLASEAARHGMVREECLPGKRGCATWHAEASSVAHTHQLAKAVKGWIRAEVAFCSSTSTWVVLGRCTMVAAAFLCYTANSERIHMRVGS
jgi:hypothetical protein